MLSWNPKLEESLILEAKQLDDDLRRVNSSMQLLKQLDLDDILEEVRAQSQKQS